MMNYTLDFSLSHDEEASLEQIVHTILKATLLLNDYYSWEKEYDHYMRTGGTMPLVNAVSVLKHLHGIDDNTKALGLLRDRILGYEMQYCKLRDEYLRIEDPGANVRRFFGFLEVSMVFCSFALPFLKTRFRVSLPVSFLSFDLAYIPPSLKCFHHI